MMGKIRRAGDRSEMADLWLVSEASAYTVVIALTGHMVTGLRPMVL